MRLVAFGMALCLFGCASSRDEFRTVTPSSESTPLVDREVTIQAAPLPEPAVARPRLSQTITLGQGTEAQYTPSAPVQAQSQSQSVIVNNNIVVEQTPRYGGYVGYGYAPYGRYGAAYPDGRASGRTSSPPVWGSTGWEGARRTAAPGQTPGVGGNWAPAPSYGPAPMR